MSLYCKQKGFVILIVLIFMQILILLGWYALENVLLLVKFSKNMVSHDALYHPAETILSQIELETISELPPCIIPFTESGRLTAKPLNWWQSSQTCSGNFRMFQYYYVVEPLVIDSCAVIEHVKARAAYFRITLLLQSNTENARIFLQSTIIRPSMNVLLQQCEGSLHMVQAGRQSWRELDY